MKKPLQVLAVTSLCLLSLITASGARAQMPAKPVLKDTYPAAIAPRPSGSWGITINGDGLEPPARIFGVSDYDFNTNGNKFYYLVLQLRTKSGLQAPHRCSQGSYWESDQCSLNSLGNYSITIQLNPITWPDWANGVELLLTWHLLVPSNGGSVDIASNTIRVPFSMEIKDAPAIDGMNPAGFQSDAKNWQLELHVRNVDETVNTLIDDVAVSLDAMPSLDGSSATVVTVTVPQKSRADGHHTLKVCRWVQSPYSAGQTASCSAAQSFSVQQVYERMAAPVAHPGLNEAQLVKPGEKPVMQVAPGANVAIAREAASEMAASPSPRAAVAVSPTLKVTCGSTPVYRDEQLDPYLVQGKPLIAQSGQTFTAGQGSVKAKNGKTLRAITLNGTAYIDAACVQ